MIDLINGNEFTPSHVFGETMRVFDDITLILSHLITNLVLFASNFLASSSFAFSFATFSNSSLLFIVFSKSNS